MKVKQAEFRHTEQADYYEYKLTSDYDGNGHRVGGSKWTNTPPMAEMTVRIDKPLLQVGDDVPIESPKPDNRKFARWFGDPYMAATTLTCDITEFRRAVKESGREWTSEGIGAFLREEVDA